MANNLYKLGNRMSFGSYFTPPVKRVNIEKREGGNRPPHYWIKIRKHKCFNKRAVTTSRSKQVNAVLDDIVGFVVVGFQVAIWFACRVVARMESAIGERAAEVLVEEQEEQRDVNTLGVKW